ncbi:MAG: winged helix-turn-helix transcriptional regulator, partial [Sphaerochaetaceae bacterium]|nr:winged helix-turn-helix transcriptional regulator [Sphaerochaetaceae bacterium]
MCATKQFDKSDLQIIRSIQLLDQPTRQSISDEVGLSLQKVSKVLKRLESITTIRKAGKSFSASGRPSFIYELAPKEMHTLGASINNRGMTIVAIDATKEVVNVKELQFSEKALRADDSALLIDEIIAPLKAMKAELTIAGSAPSAIG